MVVDDEPDGRYMVRRIVNGWGYDAEEMLSKEFNELTDYIIKPYASESLLTKVKNIFMPFQITRKDRAVVRA